MWDIYNENCLDTLSKIQDNVIDLIVTDPPYKLTPRGSAGTMSGYWTSEKAKRGMLFDVVPCKEYLPEFYRILKDKTICYIMCNNVNLQEMINTATDCGFHFVKALIWEKNNKICGRYYMNSFEYILMFRKGGDRPINNCGTSDIIKVPFKKMKDTDKHNLHDTEKPVELMKILIDNSSDFGQLVLDPFMGIGSTGVAAMQLNRSFIGIEIDKKYYDIAEERIKNEANL